MVALKLAEYNAAESCGKCTPCREGTPRIVEALAAGSRPADGQASDGQDLRDLSEIVGAASLCGLGQMAGQPGEQPVAFLRGPSWELAYRG